jgi:hypothetical protein
VKRLSFVVEIDKTQQLMQSQQCIAMAQGLPVTVGLQV